MTSQTPQGLYTQGSGTQGSQIFLTFFADRAPTTLDIGDWKVGQRWVDNSNTLSASPITAITQANPGVVTVLNGFSAGQLVTFSGVGGMIELNGNTYTITSAIGTQFTIDVDTSGFSAFTSDGVATVTADREYILNGFTSSQGVVKANWTLLNSTPSGGAGSGAVDTLTGDVGGPVPADTTGNINILGTAGQITVTGTPATNTLTLSLAGGGEAVDSFSPDTGTDPVVPTAGGLVNIKGQTIPNVSGIRVTGALNELDFAMFSPFVGDFAFTSTTSGDTETLTVNNTSNTASSQAQALISVAGATAGDPWTQWSVGTTSSFSAGIDNSDSDIFKYNYSASGSVSPSTGTTLNMVDPVGSAITTPKFQWLGGEMSLVSTVATAGNNPIIEAVNTNIASVGSAVVTAINQSTNTAGLAFLEATNSTTGGDAFLRIGRSVQWTQGEANATGQYRFGIGANPSTVTIFQNVTQTGAFTRPLQPAFLAVGAGAANVTGNGTAYTVGSTGTAWTEIFDQGNNFNTNGTFTAPVTGRYFFSACIEAIDIGVGHTSGFLLLVGTSRTLASAECNPFTVSTTGDMQFMFSGMIDLAATNTCVIQIQVNNSTQTVDVNTSTSNTWFSGYLVC